jgi:hypothetical protein
MEGRLKLVIWKRVASSEGKYNSGMRAGCRGSVHEETIGQLMREYPVHPDTLKQR